MALPLAARGLLSLAKSPMKKAIASIYKKVPAFAILDRHAATKAANMYYGPKATAVKAVGTVAALGAVAASTGNKEDKTMTLSQRSKEASMEKLVRSHAIIWDTLTDQKADVNKKGFMDFLESDLEGKAKLLNKHAKDTDDALWRSREWNYIEKVYSEIDRDGDWSRVKSSENLHTLLNYKKSNAQKAYDWPGDDAKGIVAPKDLPSQDIARY